MFKKPLSNLKTSAPLRGSDRRKLRQKVVQAYQISTEEGDLLVPDGLQSVKFLTHLEEPGTAYLAPDGRDPLWFSIGKDSDELIPTVYTLWKRPGLLPWVSTPEAVIPKLIGGADLMIPGVVQWSPAIAEGQLVAIVQYTPDESKRGYPLAVGHMSVDKGTLHQDGKGKAVYVKHTWRDTLWDMGRGGEIPDPMTIDLPASPQDSSSQVEDVSAVLRSSLLQAIQTTLSKTPQSSFPIIATTLYSNSVLPSRPAFPSPYSETPVDVKHSSHKSLTAFLKAMEKEGLITLKVPKGKAGGDVVVTAVNAKHPDVESHSSYTTIADIEARKEKREQREVKERSKVKEHAVTEKYKPMGSGSVRFFEDCGKNTSALYTAPEIRAIINQYVQDKQLVNLREQQYINIDETLQKAMQGCDPDTQFLKRDDLVRFVIGKMQSWHEITPDGKDPILKKGALKPISVAVKIRQGRKAATLITGFEPFLLVAEDLADELRKLLSPAPGKSSGQEVLVQGKQAQVVTDLLLGKGVPKKWIEVHDLSDGKKK
ncbi:hypothetical protein PLEOSDRAFT_1079102 [Pleurotus ostreatus PC15]|uniref:SUI1 domain-containing protein n=1 Tax=Pleurotus ostreatus (strain PC15) TaxID=1137138 RepID=A0A067NA33_PLEO1|nr:hypothetical protein PLEOSDRAFT_1079102 [Pleurotus ostreatus PC15]